MPTSNVREFAAALDELDVTLDRASPETFEAVLGDAVETPAVGVPLPYDGVSFDGTPVEADPSPASLDAAHTGVTAADCAVASYGSVVIRPTGAGEGPVSLYVERHVAVLRERDVLPGMEAAFERLADVGADGGDAIVATGPSATADMGALVRGAHGPKDVHVVLLEES